MPKNVLALVILIALVLGCATPRGAGAPAERRMLEQELDQWVVAWSSGDLGALLPLFSDDVYYEDVTFAAVSKGKAALREFATGVFGAFADLKFDPKSRFISADGKWGSIEWVFLGRQIKDLPGLPATNRPFEVRGATVVEFRGGKIVRNSDYWDLMTYLKQVGVAN